MKKLGQGSFTTAFLEDSGTVLLHSVDFVKECAGYGWTPEHRLFPEIERLEDVSPNNDLRAYRMEYFPRVKSLKSNLEPREWLLYQTLRKLSIVMGAGHDRHNFSQRWREEFQTLPDEFEDEKQGLLEMVDALANYGEDACFEISPRNVAVKEGKLILLDCFFLHSQLTASRENKYYRKGLL